jgi:hypothetical protein
MTTNDPAAARNFPRGLPIYDRQGNQLGTVSSLGVHGNYLVMSKRALFRNDVSIPLSTIQSSDAQGVYLNRTREEIHNLTLGGWSSLGNVDINTGVHAGDGINSTIEKENSDQNRRDDNGNEAGTDV